MELKMIQPLNHSRSSTMKPIAIALTALVATTAIAPMASAGVDFDQLRRENLEKDAVRL
jgi:hypothetical protein